jgi:GDP-D-mannose 3', 5'-epimerase
MKTILVTGAGGFIGTHLVNEFKQQGHLVIAADLKYPEYSNTTADEFHIADLREADLVHKLFVNKKIDEVYQLAADMGGAGYIFTGDNDANIMHNSAQINLNILDAMREHEVKRVFYSSSACIYPAHNQTDPDNPDLKEDSAYPANPDSEYGWEKIFSERMYQAYARNYGIHARIARFHNIFGPLGSWNNGKEKSPAALCRKVAETTDGQIEVWGPGIQTRSYLYIEECVKGIQRIMESDLDQPVNLGSERMISLNNLALLIAEIAGKKITINNIPGPVGVMGRSSHNQLIEHALNWRPDENLEYGLEKTYEWIYNQVHRVNK